MHRIFDYIQGSSYLEGKTVGYNLLADCEPVF
jgi:hypothetical protein